jgi:hypothetical protein
VSLVNGLAMRHLGFIICNDSDFLGCDTVQSCRQVPAFQRNTMPLSSGLKCVFRNRLNYVGELQGLLS